MFLDLNGFAIEAAVYEQERLMLELAAGNLVRTQLASWLTSHVVPR